MALWSSLKSVTAPARAFLQRRWAPVAAMAVIIATILYVITDPDGLVRGGSSLSNAEAASLAQGVAAHLEIASLAQGGDFHDNTDLEQVTARLARSGDRDVLRALADLNTGDMETAFAALEDSAQDLGHRDPAAAAGLWFAIGVLAEAIDPQRAITAYENALERAPDDPRTLDRLGGVHLDQGDDDRAEALIQNALALAIAAESEPEQARIQSSLGALAWRRGNFEAADGHYARSLELADLNGDLVQSARQLGNRGLIATTRGDTASAETYYDRAYRLMEAAEDILGKAMARNNLANIYLQRGELDRAKDMYRLTLAELEAAGQPQLASMTMASLGNVAESRRDLEAAGRLYERSLNQARQHQYIRAIERAARNAGWMALRRGDHDRARVFAEAALAAAERIPDPASEADVLILSVGIAASAQDDELARAHAARAFGIIDQRGVPPDTRAYLHDALALSAFFAGDYSEAERQATQARTFYEEAGQIPAMAEQELRLATLAFRREAQDEGCNWLEAAEVNYGRFGFISEANRMVDRRESEGCPPRETGGQGDGSHTPD
ncbi:MAG: hypothetical protein COW29_07410 [Rhodobacterales bacterium CG15_BIG_FIL_POST_REV_8_21_14_020_59_13]|nr:MAG: hypothetical protein COW29_07410 [Rhodobacterales bacterium CG15_BIG_FIL_POST_REV_8_21_14_020_59_13]